MESIIDFIGSILFAILMLGFWVFVISLIINALKSAGETVKKAITGKEPYFGPAQLKLIDEKLEDSDLIFKKIMFRGAIPTTRNMNMSYSISAFDQTEEDLKHVISILDHAQEPNTICFGVLGEIGNISPGDCLTDWCSLGTIFPNFIQPPRSGLRKIYLHVRMFDSSNPPTINAGLSNNDGDIILEQGISFDFLFQDKGYEEVNQDRDEAKVLTLKIGVAVAMENGVLDDSEGEIFKNWILKQISAYSGDNHEKHKKLLNEAFKDAFTEAELGELSLTPLVERLSEIGGNKSKYQAVELCFDIMAADGQASPGEIAIIRNVAESLGLEMHEIEQMRENVTLSLSSSIHSEAELESLVGLESNWTDEQKKRHLRMEFQKWSNRINALSEGDERDSAQIMLENIAKLRKKYD